MSARRNDAQSVERLDFEQVLSIIAFHRNRAVASVNIEHVLTNWELGGYLSLKIARDGWGKSTIDNLVDYIHAHEPTARGYRRSNLYSMVAVYDAFSSVEFLELVNRYKNALPNPMDCAAAMHGKVQMPSGLLAYADGNCPDASGQIRTVPSVLLLSMYSNLLEIVNRTHSSQERLFYIVYAYRERLKNRELRKCIVNDTYMSLLGGDKKNFSKALKEKYPCSPVMFKDAALLDYLDLPKRHKESRVRKGIVKHIKEFVLEFGKDFLFMDEEYTIQVGAKQYRSDLLFYHRGLQCLVAIELKARDFEPADMGQLEFYLEALDRDVKRSNENPSIGILLCKNADKSVVEYALSRTMSPAMVAEYKRMLIPREVLQRTFDEYLALPEIAIVEGRDKTAAENATTAAKPLRRRASQPSTAAVPAEEDDEELE